MITTTEYHCTLHLTYRLFFSPVISQFRLDYFSLFSLSSTDPSFAALFAFFVHPSLLPFPSPLMSSRGFFNLNARPFHRAAVAASSSSSSSSSSSLGRFGEVFSRTPSASAQADVQRYLKRYPGQKEHTAARKNLDFYLNRIPSAPSPSGTIDHILKHWYGDYDLLESHHGYIQWLMPIREDGVNYLAQKLYLHEIAGIRSDSRAIQRLLASYELMLDFYGMKLIDSTLGEIARSAVWEGRYRHLNRSMHNYLRITRILKCLGEFGYEHLKIGFMIHCLNELASGELNVRSVGVSARDYWFTTLRTASDAAILKRTIATMIEEESKANKEGRQYTGMTKETIRSILIEAQTARLRDENDKSAKGEDIPSAATSSSASAPYLATSESSVRSNSTFSFGSFNEDEIDSPRAEAEGLAPSRDQSFAQSSSSSSLSPSSVFNSGKRKADSNDSVDSAAKVPKRTNKD